MFEAIRPAFAAGLALALALLLPGTARAGDTDIPPDAVLPPPAPFTLCEEHQRGRACTRHYEPVCGAVDKGVRCVTSPCDSTEYRDFGNACAACAEAGVQGYTEGSCARP